MDTKDAGSLLHFGNVSLSGGELILSVIRIYSEHFGRNPDLAKLNLLIFLLEGDGEIESDIMFSDTPFGPKSYYINEFVSRNTEFVKSSSYTKNTSNMKADTEVHTRLSLTDLGKKIADIAIDSLSERDVRALKKILSRWGMEKHTVLLTYVCLFYEDFCTSVERKTEEE